MKEVADVEFFVVIAVTSEAEQSFESAEDCKLCRVRAQGIDIEQGTVLAVNQSGVRTWEQGQSVCFFLPTSALAVKYSKSYHAKSSIDIGVVATTRRHCSSPASVILLLSTMHAGIG